MKAKLVVYTCITGGKDRLVNMPPEKGVDYICFSDKPFRHPTWQYRPIERLGEPDNRRIARRYKLLSHIYFPEQDTIWIDGRIKLNIPARALMQKYIGSYCCRLHHSRTCIYDEADEVLRLKFENVNIATNQMDRYRALGYPEDNGLHETGILIRRHCFDTTLFNSLWWAELSSGSKRDQLSFDYVKWMSGKPIQEIDRSDITVLKHQKRTNERF